MNLEIVRRASMSPVARPARGDHPNPGRSRARTRPRPARPGAAWIQLRWDPSEPVDHEERGLRGPVPQAMGDGPLDVGRAELGKLERHSFKG